MDIQLIQKMINTAIEEQVKKSSDRESALLQYAKEREQTLLDEIKELKKKNSETSAQASTREIGKTDTQSTSAVQMLIDIELFYPTINEVDDDYGKFEEWLKRFNLAIECSVPNISDKDKVKYLLTRLSKEAFSEYNKQCLPQDVTDFSYEETTKRLRELFDLPQYSLFADRYECLRITKEDSENFRNYFQRVKTALRKFNFNELKEEQFYCLVALAGIRNPEDEAARSCILQRLNADGDKVRFDQVIGDCLNFLKVREAADASFQRSEQNAPQNSRRYNRAKNRKY